jgi:hypothetical protein
LAIFCNLKELVVSLGLKNHFFHKLGCRGVKTIFAIFWAFFAILRTFQNWWRTLVLFCPFFWQFLNLKLLVG